MDGLKLFLFFLLLFGIVANIVGWTDYYRHHRHKVSHPEQK